MIRQTLLLMTTSDLERPLEIFSATGNFPYKDSILRNSGLHYITLHYSDK